MSASRAAAPAMSSIVKPAARRGAWLRRAGATGALAAATAVPFFIGDYDLFQLSRVLTVALAVLALNLLTGRTGQISVGHGALFGIGAYIVAILVVQAEVPYVLALVAATVLTFFCGLALGLPALRIRGLYLGLLTLAVAILLPPVIKRFGSLTGGTSGLTLATPESPLGSLTPAQWMYLLNLAILAAAMVGVANLCRGRSGRMLDAIRESELMATANGVRIGRVKTLVFGISAALAGLGGGLYVLVLGTATPDTYTVTLSLSLLAGAVIGGIRSNWGAVLGAAFVVYVPDQTASLGESAPQFAYAAALLLAVYVLPGGIAAVPQRVRSRLVASRSESGSTIRKVTS